MKTIPLFLILLALIAPMIALADEPIPDQEFLPPANKRLSDTLGTNTSIIDLFNRITNWIFAILLAVAVIFVLMAAFSYMSSGGNSETTMKAHNKLVYAAVAVAVAVLAKGIVAAIRIIVTDQPIPGGSSEQYIPYEDFS